MTIDGEVLAMQRRSYHFESYLQQMFKAFVVESMRMVDSSRMHYDIMNVPVAMFVRIYFDTCCGSPVVAKYRAYSTQRPAEMKFIFREITEQTLDRCANEFFHTCARAHARWSHLLHRYHTKTRTKTTTTKTTFQLLPSHGSSHQKTNVSACSSVAR